MQIANLNRHRVFTCVCIGFACVDYALSLMLWDSWRLLALALAALGWLASLAGGIAAWWPVIMHHMAQPDADHADNGNYVDPI